MTAPLVAALLRCAFPALRVLDAAVATGGLWPWWPEAALALPPQGGTSAEAALLARFGVVPPDPAMPPPDLVVTRGEAAPWLAAGAMVLTDVETSPAAPQILLLMGCGGAVQQRQLLLPEDRLDAAFAALSAAAASLARPGWDWGARRITPRLATFTLIAPADATGAAMLPVAGLPCWREAPGRLRILLGVLPARPWRITVRAEGATAMLLDGVPWDGVEAFTPQPGVPVILGIAGPGAMLQAIGIAAA